MSESRFEEIKRCLERAEELGGTTVESPYDLYVTDVRYLVDLVESLQEQLNNRNADVDKLMDDKWDLIP